MHFQNLMKMHIAKLPDDAVRLTASGYWQDTTSRFWLLNEQRGWVEVPATGRALCHALQRRPTREDRRYRSFDRDGRAVWVSVPA